MSDAKNDLINLEIRTNDIHVFTHVIRITYVFGIYAHKNPIIRGTRQSAYGKFRNVKSTGGMYNVLKLFW